MSILSLQEATVASIEKEIAPFIKDINDYLSLPSTVTFLNDEDQANHFVHRFYKGVRLSQPEIDALKLAIEGGEWESVLVENRLGGVQVSFYKEEQPEPPVEPEPEEEDPEDPPVDPEPQG